MKPNLELLPPYNTFENPNAQKYYCLIDINQPNSLGALNNHNKETTIPIFYMPSNSEENEHAIIKKHVDVAKKAKQQGFISCAIGAYDDGYLQKHLSKRFNDNKPKDRIKLLIDIYNKVKEIVITKVILTVEELAPGGIDPTDGIYYANELYKNGLDEIIATQGTKDFMPLYRRRETKKENHIKKTFDYTYTEFASALWLLKIKGLKVISLSYFHNYIEAHHVAKAMGLSGLIKKADR